PVQSGRRAASLSRLLLRDGWMKQRRSDKACRSDGSGALRERRTMRRQLGWILVLVIALMSIGAPVAAGSAKVLVVDDDGKASATNCNASTKAYKRIQGAINAASNNTTILVCPGDYFQEIEIV